jgi:hypothetical protein
MLRVTKRDDRRLAWGRRMRRWATLTAAVVAAVLTGAVVAAVLAAAASTMARMAVAVLRPMASRRRTVSWTLATMPSQ